MEYPRDEKEFSLFVRKQWGKAIPEEKEKKSVIGSTFILLSGIPGSGKTSLARQLSARLNIPHFDFSNFCKCVYGGHPAFQAQYQSVGEVVNKLVGEHLEQGLPIIYDTTAINPSIRRIHMHFASSAMRSIVIWVDTDPSKCRERLIKYRKEDSLDLTLGKYRPNQRLVRTFDDFVRDFEPPNEIEYLRHQEDSHFEETYRKLLCWIDSN